MPVKPENSAVIKANLGDAVEKRDMVDVSVNWFSLSEKQCSRK